MSSSTPHFAALVEYFEGQERHHLAQAVREILAEGNNPQFREWAVDVMTEALEADRAARSKWQAILSNRLNRSTQQDQNP